jgi:hypothetical protein
MRPVDYEYRAVELPRDATREQTRELLLIHADFGDWELHGHTIYPGGRRRVTVRRRRRATA